MFEKYMAIGGCIFGVAVLTLMGVGINKVNKISKKFDKGVSELKDVTVKDIQQAMIEEAVKNAAKDSVEPYVARAHREIVSQAKDELSTEVKAAVNDVKNDIRSQTVDEVAKQVAAIDITDMKRSVREKAETTVLGKFDDNLQDLLDKFSGNLSRISRVYGSIEDALKSGAMTKNDNGKITFSLGN